MNNMPLFAPPAPDELNTSGIAAKPNEMRIYSLLREHHGYRNPLSIKTLKSITGLSERVIKDVVHELIVTHKQRIGALRGEHPGYFMIETADDLDVAVKPYEGQILAMLRRLRVLQGKTRVREWLGQQAVNFE